MILLPGCQCCCPCGPATLPWNSTNSFVLYFAFSNGDTNIVCSNDGSTLTLNNLAICEYTSTYDFTVDFVSCQATVFFLSRGNSCLTINGWTTNCSAGITAIAKGLPC